MILPEERQVILELSHVILDHTHHGMHIYPTAMTAALLLQHSSGLERSESLTISSSNSLSISMSVGELMERLEWLKEQVILRGSKVYWDTGVYTERAFLSISC